MGRSGVKLAKMNERVPKGAREQIKQTACRLFARHGIDGVTVREIVAASGQKNHGSLTYYFGSKEALVREIVADGARVIDERRNAQLDALEAAGGPRTIREVVEALVIPSINLPEELGGDEQSYTRFIALLSLTHRDMFIAALEGRLNSGYLRCLQHLRRLLADMPERTRNRRMVFLEAYLNSVLSLREWALAGPAKRYHMWLDENAIPDVVETIVAMLTAGPP